MRCYELNLPLADNAGKALDATHGLFQKLSLAIAGGYTKRPSGEGAWLDPESGTVYYDRIIPYVFACEGGTFEQVKRLAFDLFADQKAIFWREIEGAVIERRPAARMPDRASASATAKALRRVENA